VDRARVVPLRHGLTESRLANLGAHAIADAFEAYHGKFRSITRRARARFETRDWQGMREDAAERLDLYRKLADRAAQQIRSLVGHRHEDTHIWMGMKAVYSGLIADRDDWEIAETFFNSITRRIFATVGVDAAIEFVDSDFDFPPTVPRQRVFRAYDRPPSIGSLVRTILTDHRHAVDYINQSRDADLAAAEIGRHLTSIGAPVTIDRAEVLAPVFYRNKGAYLVGRAWSGHHLVPFAIALMHLDDGIVVDAVLLDEDDLSRVFSFAHSYFHVEAERPYELVSFLRTVMPRKRVAELYISLGYHKHGKTELYRDLLQCLASSEAQFEIAPGERGMVMEVFTLPSYDLVVKVIRDRFAEPKRTTRQSVMQKYHLVFRHDRAGRLVDAQEFEHLEFDQERFSPSLLERLLDEAAQTVSVADGRVIIGHAYIERRVTPLDLYMREAEMDAARAAAVDFGNAIKDLAASNIFPGDFWLKNFGVTRHGRVVSYDYDELSLLTECHFTIMPAPNEDFEELASEPWFYVGDSDVFPEEFRTYLKLPRGLNDLFVAQHGDLFELRFWQEMQRRVKDGEVLDIYPYGPQKRLPRD
jgi:isocitrate dehydrogenase kinase/phosphatase